MGGRWSQMKMTREAWTEMNMDLIILDDNVGRGGRSVYMTSLTRLLQHLAPHL